MEMLEKMNDLCSVEKHYFPYKKLVQTQPPPTIPYIGVYLRDLTFTEIGNPTYLDENLKIINYEKFRMLSDIILDFKKYQQVLYHFEPVIQIQTMLRYSIPTMDEDEQYQISISLEPLTKKKGSLNIKKSFSLQSQQ